MPAYVVVQIRVRDPEIYERYRRLAERSIPVYGGRYIVRGGTIDTLEGDWQPRTIVIVEFPDLESARRWYQSRDYAAALEVRDRALERNLILVDGVPASPDR